jgi:predicted dehydrogenase
MHGKIGVGIIGTGKHGSRYANHIVEDFGASFHLAAISRRSEVATEQARVWDTTLYPDWRDLVRSSRVHAVISAATPNLNGEIGRLCAEMKKPLLIEKPLATDFQEAQKLVELFDRADVPLSVAQTLRYNSVVRALQENLPTMGMLFSLSACHRLEPSTMTWLEQPEIAGGGVIFHTAVHLFDALRYITGEEIVKIRAVARNIFNHRLEDAVVAEVVLSNGCLGVIDASKVSPARTGRYEFVCENGQLHGDQIHGTLQKIEGTNAIILPVEQPGPTILPLLEDWHAFLTSRLKNPIPGSEGLAAIKVCHACRKSVVTGQWVDIAGL